MTWVKAGREPDTGLQGSTSTQIVPLIKVYPFYFWVRSGGKGERNGATRYRTPDLWVRCATIEKVAHLRPLGHSPKYHYRKYDNVNVLNQEFGAYN